MIELKVEDRLELHEIAARYGDLIDARDWEGLGLVFTTGSVLDATDLGMTLLYGLAAIRRGMDKSQNHPLGHHITNISRRDRRGRSHPAQPHHRRGT